MNAANDVAKGYPSIFTTDTVSKRGDTRRHNGSPRNPRRLPTPTNDQERA